MPIFPFTQDVAVEILILIGFTFLIISLHALFTRLVIVRGERKREER